MKSIVREFIRKGLISCNLGPMFMVILYLLLQHHSGLQNLTVNQVCIGIVSLSALAFIAGGMNVIYQIERLPLMLAILIHGSVLYVSYLGTYLLNGWLEWGVTPILVFSVIFILGYFAIWMVIYSIIRMRTARLNEILTKKQNLAETSTTEE